MNATGFDAIIVGGGPAGASCAAFCARAGVRTLVLERSVFPRDKVCGDCLNPDCWPVLTRLGVAERVRKLPHADLRAVEFVSARGRRVRLDFPDLGRDGEIAVKRSALDELLLQNAAECGAAVHQGVAVASVRRDDGDGNGHFAVETAPVREEPFSGRFLVAADGRNSIVARLFGLLPAGRPSFPGRVGLQAHIPCPAGFSNQVQMHWFTSSYGGLAPVGGNELNVSLTGPPRSLAMLKGWVTERFQLASRPEWRTIAPLDRPPARHPALANGLFLAGDAARVVEPFTGEGIFYALRSGELAAQAIIAAVREECSGARAALRYRDEHRRMYRGRLWVNGLARAAGLHPRAAGWALELARWRPELLGYLTRKVVRAGAV